MMNKIYNREFIKELEVKYECKIPETRVKIWEKQLMMWQRLDEVCRKLNITYFFMFGSLLGAIRHKGFIPWDDDIDIVMPRKDYNRFMEEAQKEFSYPLYLQVPANSANCVYSNMLLIEEESSCINPVIISEQQHQGLKIDIVPIDGIAQSRLRYKIQRAQLKTIGTLAYLRYSNKNKLHAKAKLVKVLANIFFLFYPYKKAAGRMEAIKARYSFDECSYVGDISHGFSYQKEDFKEVIYGDFEGYKAPMPKGYDRVLKTLYGNYWELPPVNKRKFSIAEENLYHVSPDISYKNYKEG